MLVAVVRHRKLMSHRVQPAFGGAIQGEGEGLTEWTGTGLCPIDGRLARDETVFYDLL